MGGLGLRKLLASTYLVPDRICKSKANFCFHETILSICRTRSLDKLFNPESLLPPRPTISNLQWISGATHVTPADMDKLSMFSKYYDDCLFIKLTTSCSRRTRPASLQTSDRTDAGRRTCPAHRSAAKYYLLLITTSTWTSR